MANLPNQLSLNKAHLLNIAEAGLIKDYAVFLKIKSKYRNSCIYGYTQKKLAQKSGLSLSCIRKYIKMFLDCGWCRMHGANLIFNPLKTFDDNKARFITSSDFNKPLKNIVKDLYLIILRYKQQRFDNLKKLGLESHNPSPSKQRKIDRILTRLNKDISELPSGSDQLQISIKTISKMFGCSVGKAHQVIKSLQRDGKITCISFPIKRICKLYHKQKMALQICAEELNGFVLGDCVYKKPCNQYYFFEMLKNE